MSDVAINVKNVSKVYRLYDNPKDRLKESLGFSKKKRYKEHYALNDISFHVNKGETVGIIGTNGSGKSTILKIITGVLNATKGNVDIQGRISALLELGAGFNSEYTGLENVYLNGTMIGFSREEIDRKLNDILEFADIGDFINQPVKTYSSGMFVRLAFAVAINIDPEILIVDEALSVGDVFFQAKCYKKFEDFKKMGKTILFVSHDLGSVAKYCDRVVLLNKGEKIAEGEPKEIVDLYKKVMAGQSAYEKDGMAENVQPQHAESQKKINDDVWKDSMLMNPSVEEYGNGSATIEDFGLFDSKGNITNTVRKFEECVLKMKVHFNQEILNPIFAFTIRDLKGTELAGTNTHIENQDMGLVNAGTTIEVTFRQSFPFQNGQYLLQLGCTSYNGDNIDVHHRLYDVCCIQVLSEKTTVGYVDLNVEVDINKEGN